MLLTDCLILAYAFISSYIVKCFRLRIIVSLVFSLLMAYYWALIDPSPDFSLYTTFSLNPNCYTSPSAIWSMPELLSRLIICEFGTFTLLFAALSIRFISILFLVNISTWRIVNHLYFLLICTSLQSFQQILNHSSLRANFAISLSILVLTLFFVKISRRLLSCSSPQSSSQFEINVTDEEGRFPKIIVYGFAGVLIMLSTHYGSLISIVYYSIVCCIFLFIPSIILRMHISRSSLLSVIFSLLLISTIVHSLNNELVAVIFRKLMSYSMRDGGGLLYIVNPINICYILIYVYALRIFRLNRGPFISPFSKLGSAAVWAYFVNYAVFLVVIPLVAVNRSFSAINVFASFLIFSCLIIVTQFSSLKAPSGQLISQIAPFGILISGLVCALYNVKL